MELKRLLLQGIEIQLYLDETTHVEYSGKLF